MKTLPPAAVAQLEGGAPIIAGAGKFVFPSGTYRYWSGYGDLTIPGESGVFKGAGAAALITPTSSQIGGAADGVTIILSALDPEIAASIELEDYHQKPVTIWRVVFSPDGHTVLGSAVYLRGRIDTIRQRYQVGGDAALDFAIEGPRRDLNRGGARIGSDSDQRVLGGAGDGSMKYVSTAARKTLYWGQKPGKIGGGFGGGGGGGGRTNANSV